MVQARQRIMLIGWDFDARISLKNHHDGCNSEILGDFIYGLVQKNPELEIYILRWRFGAFKAAFRGTNIFTLAKWMWQKNIHTKLDSVHPVGASHHQKIVIIDDRLAFCGGIDMTVGRWDTREHLDVDEGRKRPDGSGYGPWHDATCALQGDAAAALAELGRYRWERAGGKPVKPLVKPSEFWPENLDVQFENADIAIARTEPEIGEYGAIHEVEKLYLDCIAKAQDFIYAENQYFASRRIAEAMSRRLKEPDGPEIIIVCPESAEGWLEPIAMDSARARLHNALRKCDKYDRLRIYHPYTAGGQPIYVHAKILIIDDRILRIGSANMNNRSLRLDTECDIVIDTAEPKNSALGVVIGDIRLDLIVEHLGIGKKKFAEHHLQSGSLIKSLDALLGSGRSLRRYTTTEVKEAEKFLADNEVFDPEGPAETFEPLAKKSLFRGELKH